MLREASPGVDPGARIERDHFGRVEGRGRGPERIEHGLVDPGELPLEAAGRELQEETGWQADSWQYLGSNPANPVFMSSYIHTFLATGLSATSR